MRGAVSPGGGGQEQAAAAPGGAPASAAACAQHPDGPEQAPKQEWRAVDSHPSQASGWVGTSVERSVDSAERSDPGILEQDGAEKGPGGGKNDFHRLLNKWVAAAKSTTIEGLDEVVSLGLLKYIAAKAPHIISLNQTEELRRLPIYGTGQ